MCELFGISSRHPARINICLHQISRHGGLDGPHGDGWGVAFYDGAAVRLLREPGPARDSPWVRFIEERSLRSSLVVSHIRHATQGAASLSNTQPYVRELGGRMHVFAHNGDLGEAAGDLVSPRSRYRPVGDTDSEGAFCYLLGSIEDLWLAAKTVPPLEDRLALVRRFTDVVAAMGPANFLYSDGDVLFAHSDCRRNPGEAEANAPGLFALWRNFVTEGQAFEARGLHLSTGGPDARAVLLASVPLTAENWIPLPRRTVLAFAEGRLVATAPRASAVPLPPGEATPLPPF